jgi:ribosomal protein S12 methylthiotransferase
MSKKIGIITLGCDKNTVDSEHMLGLLTNKGYTTTELPKEADIIIINTCGFINDAKEQSINTILSAVEYKKKKPGIKIIACGCMVQKYWKELADEIPEIDGFLGSNNVHMLPEILSKIEIGHKPYYINENTIADDIYLPRQLSESTASSYLKIAEGCNNKCTYCAIPAMRGPYRSRNISVLIEEVMSLVEQGVKEIALVAQDITQYGIDLGYKVNLVSLLEELIKVDGLQWVRLLYCYPSLIDDELIEFVRGHKKICNYLDIPLQHADRDILKKMGRNQNPDQIYKLIQKIREEIPDIAIRSTFIVGFPGESEKQFNNLLDFLVRAELDWVGAFKYSQEDGTLAACFPNQVSEEVKEERYHILMSLQRNITNKKNKRWIGRKLPVLVEGKWEEEAFLWQGRIEQQARDVDGVVIFKATNSLKPGDFVEVKITDVDDYDLLGEM